MEFKDLVKSRYACRNYLEKPVPDEAIPELLEIARYSASGVNLQPWKIKVGCDDYPLLSNGGRKDRVVSCAAHRQFTRVEGVVP